MIVILEGCDCTGKSTCFNRLKEAFKDASFIKESYTDSIEEKKARVNYLVSRADDSDIVIYDRATMIDDFIYEKVMSNNESELSSFFNRDFIVSNLNKCVIIYLDLDNTVITDRLVDRGDDFIAVHQLNKIKKCYRDFLDDINHYEIDVTGLQEQQVFEVVKEIIDNETIKDR